MNANMITERPLASIMCFGGSILLVIAIWYFFGLVPAILVLVSILLLGYSCRYAIKHQSENGYHKPVRLYGYHSSAFLSAYLVLFVPTTVYYFFDIWHNKNVIWNKLTEGGDQWIQTASNSFDNTLGALLILLCLHFIRIYITVEMIENPHIAKIVDYKPPSLITYKRAEQVFRILVIILLSFKLVTFKIIPQFNTLKWMSIYLAVIYFFLLCWDITMLLSRRAEKVLNPTTNDEPSNKFKSPLIVMISSAIGLIMFTALAIIQIFYSGASCFYNLNTGLGVILAFFFLSLLGSTVFMWKGLLLYLGHFGLSLIYPGTAEVCSPSKLKRKHYCDWQS